MPTAEFCDFTGDSRFAYNRANVTAQSSYVRSNFGVTAGFEYEVENAFLSTVDVNHARRNNQAGFLDFRYRPLRRVSLNFGGRAEANANFGTRVVPRIGGSVVARYGTGMVGDTLVRAFYGQGIKEPRFDQTLGDNFGDLGNPSLKPESSKNWSAGIEQKLLNDRVRLSADYFYNSFYNIVSFAFCTADPTNPTGNSCGLTIPGAPATGFGFFFNTDRALARGISVAGESKFTRWLNVAGNYTYDDTRVLQAPNAFDPYRTAGKSPYTATCKFWIAHAERAVAPRGCDHWRVLHGSAHGFGFSWAGTSRGIRGTRGSTLPGTTNLVTAFCCTLVRKIFLISNIKMRSAIRRSDGTRALVCDIPSRAETDGRARAGFVLLERRERQCHGAARAAAGSAGAGCGVAHYGHRGI